ncbi:MAG: glycosyltransferase [Gammaproteobacteria bacterium]|nr:glycosyltransferase [Gammaproteobacteria bacterium]
MLKKRNADRQVKVSVCVVTYNQEKYIRQCIQSLVDQEADFDFEVIVADDYSTDGTRQIVLEFANNYPELVKPVFHEKNIGALKNFVFVHNLAEGEYIAHMDGDDYALPGKLKTQVDYLNSHPECNIVWHRVYIMNDASGKMAEDLIDYGRLPKSGFNRADILRFITIGMNSSKMYRSSVKGFDLPRFPVVDYFMNVEQIGSGVARFVGDVPLGVYRAGIGIASSGNTTRVLLRNSFLYFSEKYPEYKRDICAAALVLFFAAFKNRKWSNCILFAGVVVKVIRMGAFLDIWRDRAIIGMLRIPNSVKQSVVKK